MGDFVARRLEQLPDGHEFIASDFFGKMVGVVEPGRDGELIPVSIDGEDVIRWWDKDKEVVIPA